MGKNTNKWALGALLGAVTGYLAGILTAPKSGKETRKDISDAATKAKREAEKKLKDLHAELNELLDTGKTKASKFSKSAKDEYKKLQTKATGARSKASEVLSAIHEGEADDKELQAAIDEAKKASEHLRKFLATYEKEAKKK